MRPAATPRPNSSTEIRGDGLVQGGARHREPAGRQHPRRAAARRCSTSAPTTTSASPTIRTSSRRRTQALDAHGFGLSSVRFICGTQDLHKHARSEDRRASSAPRTPSSTRSCFDANGGLFETLLGEEDAIICDELNHASIIDGIRLCKAERLRYRHGDMADLRAQARRAPRPRASRLIATDGVFSMDGDIAPARPRSATWPSEHDALVMVDDCHATGFIGPHRPRHAEHRGVHGPRSTSSPARSARRWAAPAGGFTAAQAGDRRPAAPALAALPLLQHASPRRSPPPRIKVLDLLDAQRPSSRERLHGQRQVLPRARSKPPASRSSRASTRSCRHARRRRARAEDGGDLLDQGIYVIGFCYPVVPKGQARIRVQLSAAHERDHLDRAIAAFRQVGKELGVIR